MKKRTKIILGIVAFLLVTVLSFSLYTVSTLNKIAKVDLPKEDLGIDKEVQAKIEDKKITNIVLFGIDQVGDNPGRSDSIIIATFDETHNKLKLTSIMRDSYVNIPGRGYDKINHAYAFGRAPLAIKTINQNFGLNIDNYAKINFDNMEHLIDAIGGVKMEIKDFEIPGVSSVGITKAGVYNLNGKQALAYSRIRKVDGDSERTERQRNVLTAMFNKLSSIGPTELPSVMNKLLPYVETSLGNGDIINLGLKVLKSGIKNIEQERFPLENLSKGEKINGIYYLTFDEKSTKDQIYKYIFEDIKPVQ
ncbi:LCP family protein [Clostridium sp. UBA4548]|uniref:LCP family protein n=1 Tax=Clostridium sp. UBA4548 TaxID=1946361 RepID=UPI0025BA2BCB|nr:LCP family protein [Clostridium sp. UBA4548]